MIVVYRRTRYIRKYNMVIVITIWYGIKDFLTLKHKRIYYV